MLKIKIESPLVNITFEDEMILNREGYIKHEIPENEELLILIDKLKEACSQVILETVRAKKYGCIDLKKWQIPDNFKDINVTLDK